MGKESGKNGPDPGEGGRPTLYRESFDEQAYNYTLLGAKDSDLAKFFGVSEVTINAWKKCYPNFLKSIKNGKEAAVSKVARSMFEKACGYTYQETKEIFETNSSGKQVLVKREVITKKQAPDTGAGCFILKNRGKYFDWADKHEIDLTKTIVVNLDQEDKELQ